MFKVQMFKVKIPNPNCKSHVQNQNSETHASFSTSRFRNSFLLFKLKFYRIFGALAFPKRRPSQKYKTLFDALKIRSPLFMFKVKFPKPTLCSKPSQDSGTHVSCSHVQSQDSKSQLQVSSSQSRFRNPRLTCNPAVRKLIGVGSSNWAALRIN